MKTSRLEIAGLAAILALAAALRIYALNADLWYDEILTLTQFVRLPAAELAQTYGSLNNHILYTWLAKLSVVLFGEHAWSLRLPAVMFGLGSIWASWRLVRESGLKATALVVALLLAVSYHHVWFSQNARGYTGMLFFAMLGSLCLLYALRSGRMAWWLAYGLCSAGALLVHLSAAFLVAGQAIAILISLFASESPRPVWMARLGGSLAAGALCIAVTLTVFLPLIPGMVSAFGAVSGDAPDVVPKDSTVSQWTNPLWTAWEMVSSFGVIGLLLPVAGAFAIWGAVRLLKLEPVVWGGLLLSIPFTLAALLFAGMRIWPRYFFIDIGVLLACAVAGAFAFAEQTPSLLPNTWRNFVTANRLKTIGAALLVGASIPLLLSNYRYPKQDFSGPMRFIAASEHAGDQVVTAGLADVAYGRYLAPGWSSITKAEQLDAVLRRGPLWVVIAFPDHLEAHHPDIQAMLQQRFDMLHKFKGTLAGGSVMVWRSRDGAQLVRDGAP